MATTWSSYPKDTPAGPLSWVLDDGTTPESARRTIISYLEFSKSRADTAYRLRIGIGALEEIIRSPKAVSRQVGERSLALLQILKQDQIEKRKSAKNDSKNCEIDLGGKRF